MLNVNRDYAPIDENPVQIDVYISSGEKNGFYTLRVRRSSSMWFNDYYIRNLSTDADVAVRKAREYFDRVFAGRGNATFAGYANFELDPHGTHLKPWEREQRDLLNQGLFPFGKHKGSPIADADDGYIIWWAKQEVTPATSHAATGVIEQAKSIADERGLWKVEENRKARYEAEKARYEAEKAASNFVGEIGERLELDLTVVFTKVIETRFGELLLNKLVDADGNRFTYFGYALVPNDRRLERGDRIRFRAAVKDHNEYKSEKSTVLTRPTKVEHVAPIAT